jgi:hypothetical protein
MDSADAGRLPDGVERRHMDYRRASFDFASCVLDYAARGSGSQHVIAAVQRCARHARQEGIQPEHVVVAIRAAWQGAKPLAPSSLGVTPDLELVQLIGLALDSYFGGPFD